MNSVCLSTGSAQRALVSRHAKIRSLSKSSYAPFRKTALQPLRMRSAGRLRTSCSNYGDYRSRKLQITDQRQDIWELKKNEREPLSPTQQFILTTLWNILFPTASIFGLASHIADPASSDLLLSFYYAVIFNVFMAYFNLCWIFQPLSDIFPLFLDETKQTDVYMGNLIAFVCFFMCFHLPTSDRDVVSIVIGMFVGAFVARSTWGLYEAKRAAAVSTPMPDPIEIEMEAKRKEQELKEFDARLNGRQVKPQGRPWWNWRKADIN